MKASVQTSKYFKPHIDSLQELDVYFWIAGGSLRDFFINQDPKDIDFYFESIQDRDKAKDLLVEKGFEVINTWEKHFELQKDKLRYDLFHRTKSPEETLLDFDYTVCRCALDKNYILYHDKNFFYDLKLRRLVRSPYPKRHIIVESKRLKKLLQRGFNIDKDNLILFLNDHTQD